MIRKATILLVYTGGRIGMMRDFLTAALKAFNIKKLLQKYSGIKAIG